MARTSEILTLNIAEHATLEDGAADPSVWGTRWVMKIKSAASRAAGAAAAGRPASHGARSPANPDERAPQGLSFTRQVLTEDEFARGVAQGAVGSFDPDLGMLDAVIDDHVDQDAAAGWRTRA